MTKRTVKTHLKNREKLTNRTGSQMELHLSLCLDKPATLIQVKILIFSVAITSGSISVIDFPANLFLVNICTYI